MTPPVVIAGAGPVGLLLACLLGKQGREVLLYEKRRGLPDSSMAIGITPPSLDILEELDLKAVFLRKGVRIPRAQVFERRRLCGVLDFRSSENEILSLPQFGTLELLRQRLSDFPGVEFLEGTAWDAAETAGHPGWVIACDGARSPIRGQLGIPLERKSYPATFVMADFPDTEELGPDARLYFSPRGAVESFPLPENQRRWIVQCAGGAAADLNTLRKRVSDAAGVDLIGREHGPLCVFTPERMLVKRYTCENVILCGDAAHTLSPIGGQGMNTGFADAWHLSRILPDPTPEALAVYTRSRQRAFRASARRAAMGMWLGTRTGPLASGMREKILRAVLRQPTIHRSLARTFAMRNLPRDLTDYKCSIKMFL